jgi:hypothetical protein
MDQTEVPADDRRKGTLVLLVHVALQEFGIGWHRVSQGYDADAQHRTEFPVIQPRTSTYGCQERNRPAYGTTPVPPISVPADKKIAATREDDGDSRTITISS